MKLEKTRYVLGDIVAQYLVDRESGQVSLQLLPAGVEDCYEARRSVALTQEYDHAGFTVPAWGAGSLCHLALDGFPQSTGAGGGTMKHGPVNDLLRMAGQESRQEEDVTVIETRLRADAGFEVLHVLRWREGDQSVEIRTSFVNCAGRDFMLDMLTSFSLDNLSPFDTDVSADRLALHRYRGGWSLEGRHIVDTVEQLNLDRAWHPAFAESERFGCAGAYTTKRFFPMAAVEDTKAGVVWAAQLSCVGSWQMELSRIHDGYSFSGGIADFEFGHWSKLVRPGERFDSTTAYVTVCRGDASAATQRLVRMHRACRKDRPASEAELPVIFNEWCTSWGFPTEQEMLSLAACLDGLPVRYLVIDAGWSEAETHFLGQSGNGEWRLDPKAFPRGLKALSRELKEKGLRLGIWFEFEVTTRGSRVFEKAYDHLHLTRNGSVIHTGPDRSFWDFRKPEVVAYLQEKVIDFLRDNEIGYLKVDYNGDPGVTVDGAESGGEGLRQQMTAVRDFFLSIHEQLPDLVIENCSSGGHRLDPGMMDITSMSSFSDAHECDCFPYIAASVHDLFLPEQSQIWVVLWEDMSREKLIYRLTGGFLGRMCLSGGLDRLLPWQRALLEEALSFYEDIKYILKDGVSRRIQDCSRNMYRLSGVDALVREGDNGEVLVVAHSFALDGAKTLRIPLRKGLALRKTFGSGAAYTLEDGCLELTFSAPFNGYAFHLVNA